MGFDAIHTGCVTQWCLTPSFCESIRKTKGSVALVTLTDYNRNPHLDRKILEIVCKNYEQVFFWQQGIYDAEYLHSLIKDRKTITILPPSVSAYASFLKTYPAIDYIGTRYHGGIFAMRHKARCIVITLDERMNAMQASIANNCIARHDVEDKLEKMLLEEIPTKVAIDFEGIQQWKDQFQ